MKNIKFPIQTKLQRNSELKKVITNEVIWVKSTFENESQMISFHTGMRGHIMELIGYSSGQIKSF
jgi:hypothetical protein